MAQDDIYENKGNYEEFVRNLPNITKRPRKNHGHHVLYCKNKANVKYFKNIITYFEAKDISYVRRRTLLEKL